MPIPRVKWFDDLFSMDVISKVVYSGFGDPFMSTWILWLGLVWIDVDCDDRRICCTGTDRREWDLRSSPFGESCDC